MFQLQRTYRRSERTLAFVMFLFTSVYVYSQSIPGNDTIIRITAGTFIHIRDSVSFFSNDTLLSLPSSFIPVNSQKQDKNLLFYDSLKSKLSKTLLTRKLYDFVIVTPDKVNTKQIIDNSDANYLAHTGKKIRNIEIQRLNVFGANINNPASADTKKIENLFNKTHINTNEYIIRKNLLFAKGDTISPLTLSDNERILRQLSYIDDARIIVVPVSEDEADIVVLTKDVYSLGGSYSYKGLKKGSLSVFEKNIAGTGHELGFEIPWDIDTIGSPGFGVHYYIDNIWRSFVNMNIYYTNALGTETYGFNLNRNLVSSATKYAGGISVKHMYTTEDLDTILVPVPLKYNLQDYWIARSFLLNRESVSRIIIGARYTNNNVFDRPYILYNSFHYLQNYKIFLGTTAFSIQKYYKTKLIYNYGRTEDIPHGGLFKVTLGREINEFGNRNYLGTETSIGGSIKALGYFYASSGFGTFLDGKKTEQGIWSVNMKYFSNINNFGNHMIRNFVNMEYTRGFDRNTDEYLLIEDDNGFSGFANDSIKGKQRLTVSLESVFFSPVDVYGFKFAFFSFADLSFLNGTNEVIGNGYSLASIGLGIRIRNDNMVFNTFQIRLGFFPNPPDYSHINHLVMSGEQLLSPKSFDPGQPSIITYQ
jgi:hypothetical protein